MEVPLQGNVPNLPEKVVAYEKFLDTVLRPALKDAEERRNEVNQELQDYRDLEDNIATLLQVSATARSTTAPPSETSSIILRSCCVVALADAASPDARVGCCFGGNVIRAGSRR